MKSSTPRIVAELGRPETPEETAARKAEASRVYRSSQTVRHLVAALLVTLAVVAVVVFAVPRGEPAPRDPIDVAAVAQQIQDAEGRTVIVPDAPADWVVNRASVAGDATRVWTIVYAPENGFVNVAQGFDAGPAWPAQLLGGATADDTVTIDGVEWQTYTIRDPSLTGNISQAMSTTAGADTIVVYGGGIDRETLERAAAATTAGVVELQAEETP